MRYPMVREAAERWMVDHILQKNVYKKWSKTKKNDVNYKENG